MNKDENKTGYLFTSEHVSPGHPDKLADQISDACLDALYSIDRSLSTRVAIETLLKGNVVILAGEVSAAKPIDNIDYTSIVKKVLRKNGYTKEWSPMYNDETISVANLITEQSPDIAACVNSREDKDVGAGDQGIMFGFAIDEAPDKTGWCHYISRCLVDDIFHNFITLQGGKCKYFPDFKVQCTCEYVADTVKIKLINVSIAHSKDDDLDAVRAEISEFVSQWLNKKYNNYQYYYNLVGNQFPDISDVSIRVNQNGPFTIYGPIADTGMTGRKIVCDQYGGYAPVGGGAFSGKDLTKIDRTAAYAARQIAKYVLITWNQTNDIKIKSVQCNLSYIIGDEYPISVDFIAMTRDDMRIYFNMDYLKNMFSVKAMFDRFERDIESFSEISSGCHIGDNEYYDCPWECFDFVNVNIPEMQ